MKVSLFLFLAFVGLSIPAVVAAQETILDVYDHVFDRLDLSETQSGVLVERGAFFSSPIPFDGTDDAPAMTGATWESLYYQFTQSYVGPALIPPVELVQAAKDQTYDAGHIPIALLWQPADRFSDELAGSGGQPDKLALDQLLAQYYRPVVTSLNQTTAYAAPPPYEPFNFFGVGALPRSSQYNATVSPNASFVLDPALVISADGSAITNIRINFRDGQGFQAITPGVPINIIFAEYGNVDARIKAKVDGIWMFARFSFEVIELATAESASPNFCSDTNCNAFSYTPASRSYYGVSYDYPEYHGDGVAQYRWAVYLREGADPYDPKPLRDPVIILDGFDVDDYEPARNEIIDPNTALTTSHLYGLLNVETPVEYCEPPLSDRLLSCLRGLGKDIVIVDYKDSQDFIERNALGVVDAIESIQNLLPPGRRVNAVIGLSMGGLVGREALLYMEGHGGHLVDRYISFDSPQQGANVPVSFQFFIDEWDSLPDRQIKYFRRMLDTPAFRQLVYYNYKTENSDLRRSVLFGNLALQGYPKMTQNYAIANGSSGLAQRKYDLDSPKPPDRLGTLENMLEVRGGGISLMLANGNATGVVIDADLKSAPPRGSLGEVVYRSRPQACLLGQCVTSPIGGEAHEVRNGNSYDSAPGSYRKTAESLADPLNDAGIRVSGFGRLIHLFDATILSEKHTFIPTMSALDYIPPAFGDPESGRNDLVAGLYSDQIFEYSPRLVNELEWAFRSPFDKIYFSGHPVWGDPNENFDHVFSPQEGVKLFLLDKLLTPVPTQYENHIFSGEHLGYAVVKGDNIQEANSDVFVDADSEVILKGTYNAQPQGVLHVYGHLIVKRDAALDAMVMVYDGGQVVFELGSEFVSETQSAIYVYSGGQLSVEGTSSNPVVIAPRDRAATNTTGTFYVAPGGLANLEHVRFEEMKGLVVEGTIEGQFVAITDPYQSHGIDVIAGGTVRLTNSRVSGAETKSNDPSSHYDGIRVSSGLFDIATAPFTHARLMIDSNAGYGLHAKGPNAAISIGRADDGDGPCPLDMPKAPGLPCEQLEGWYGGNNEVSGNGLGPVRANSGYVEAELTYWGIPYISNPSFFEKVNGGEVYYHPYLDAAPDGGAGYFTTPTSSETSSKSGRGAVIPPRGPSSAEEGRRLNSATPRPGLTTPPDTTYRHIGDFVRYVSRLRAERGHAQTEEFLSNVASGGITGGRRFRRLADMLRISDLTALGRNAEAAALGEAMLAGSGPNSIPNGLPWRWMKEHVAHSLLSAYATAGDGIGATAALQALHTLGNEDALAGAYDFLLQGLDRNAAPISSTLDLIEANKGVDLGGPPTEMAVSVYPNPTQGDAILQLSLPTESVVRVAVYDMIGREVIRLSEFTLETGTTSHALEFGRNLAPGTYLLRVSIGTEGGTEQFVERLTVAQ